jgi:hypothetical protein
MRADWRVILTCTFTALFPLGGCSSTSTEPAESPRLLVVVQPDTATIALGGTLRLTAGIQGGSAEIVSSDVAWVSSDERIASVVGGTVRGLKGGRVQITALWHGRQGVADVTVVGRGPCPLLAVGPGRGSFEERAPCE